MTDDLDALLARLPMKSPREAYDEMMAAREAAAAAPLPEPSIIAMPTYPDDRWGRLGGTIRFGCPLGCGWHHDENPGLEAATEPLVLPLDLSRLDEALTAQANARAEAFRVRVETAITAHYAADHPGR
ncbi:hypothetical protein [Streptomyces hokutonensis]|uniref:hypothetical protein n=1 Tax=Streptomyces hokutonensis TaxID=1306990 RepID=UPI0036B21594